MSTSKPPNPSDINPGISRPTRLGTLLPVGNQVSQIRGVASAGSVGAGIPQPVANVSASISNAVQGSTSTVNVTFHRDPSDANFSQAKVYARGYNGNPSWVQMGASDSSPIAFVLNNTGESISIAVQSSGNAGDYPLSQSPTTGVKLSQSDAGGFGTGTKTGITLTGTNGALVKKSGTAALTTTNLSNDVTTNNTPACTVVGLYTNPLDSTTPHTTDALRWNGSAWTVSIGQPRFIQVIGSGTGAPITIGHNDGPGNVGTITQSAASATESPATGYSAAASGSVNMVAGVWQGFDGSGNGKYTYGSSYHYANRVRFNQTSNCRFWCGLLGKASNGTTAYATDTPNFKTVGFRFSAGTDSTIAAYVGTSSGAQTVVSTGVAVDATNSQYFEILNTGSSFIFKIDGSQVAEISSNMPASSDNFAIVSYYADNKNTANVVSGTVWATTLMLK